jgi:hypothetical protein
MERINPYEVSIETTRLFTPRPRCHSTIKHHVMQFKTADTDPEIYNGKHSAPIPHPRGNKPGTGSSFRLLQNKK